MGCSLRRDESYEAGNDHGELYLAVPRRSAPVHRAPLVQLLRNMKGTEKGAADGGPFFMQVEPN